MRVVWSALTVALLVALSGCAGRAAMAPLEPTPTPPDGRAASAPFPTPTLPALPTRAPTVPPPTRVASTPRPTPVPARAGGATPAPLGETPTPGPSPTPDASRAEQEQSCAAAAPPARLPLPLATAIRVPTPTAPTRPTPVSGRPRPGDSQPPPPSPTARHVAVLDEASGRLLYERAPFTRVPPASVTKIAATIVALERMPDVTTVLTTSVSATALAACDGSSVMGLEPDDHVKLETLLYGMMLPSGNDAAEQVAISLAGSREAYVGWMNDEVAALGLRDTHFVTPSGMDADGHYSSAYDMALLARYAMRNPTFRTIVGTARFVGDDYYMHNLNPLIGSYEGADGVKIGYTEIAGRTIVASAARDGHRVYVSLMQSSDLYGDCVALFDWVWQAFRW